MSKSSNQERARTGVKSGSRVPLTYYRSANKKQQSQSPFKRSEQPRSRLKRFLLGTFDIVFIIILLAVFVYSLMIKPQPDLELNSETYRSKQTYIDAISEELNTPKNRNKLTFNEDQIINSLKIEFPEISNASVILPIFSQKPNFKINVASTSFVIKNNANSYLINSEGKIVAYKNDFPSLKNTPEVEDATGYELKVGEQVLDHSSVNFIRDIIMQTRRANIHVKSIKLPPKAQEVYVYLKDKPYYVKFYLGDSSLQQIGQFIAVYKDFEDSNKKPAQYIDARILGKIFYK